MDALIEALTILRKYANPKFPTNCEHDMMYVNVDPSVVSPEDLSFSDIEFFTLCTWTSAREVPQGKATLEKCPSCGGVIVYNGNYFCQGFGADCDWALPHPARRQTDRDLALRLTGGGS